MERSKLEQRTSDVRTSCTLPVSRGGVGEDLSEVKSYTICLSQNMQAK